MRPDIEAIKKRAEGATPGPWTNAICTSAYLNTPNDGRVCEAWDENGYCSIEDGEFIAHSRQDIPALVAYIEELEATLADLSDSVLDGINKATPPSPDSQDE